MIATKKHARHERDAGGRELVEDERREQVHRADRQIDLAEDHHEHLARREDREGGEVRQQRLEIPAGEEAARVQREVDRGDERDDDDRALAQAEDALAQRGAKGRGGPARRRRALIRCGRIL
jgi:hypothetical protein